MMAPILVAYASKHGATQGIAEHLGDKLTALGLDVEVRPVTSIDDVAGYGAFVIGSAAYMGSWLKEATKFVRQNQAILADHPVWLFSSGPVGTEKTDAHGQDLLATSEPKEFAEFTEAIRPRGLRVFFGAVDPHSFGLGERTLRLLPAARKMLPEGDFRDWQEIDAWAESIAHALAPEAVPSGVR